MLNLLVLVESLYWFICPNPTVPCGFENNFHYNVQGNRAQELVFEFSRALSLDPSTLLRVLSAVAPRCFGQRRLMFALHVISVCDESGLLKP